MQPQRFDISYAAEFGTETPKGPITLYVPIPSDSDVQTVDSLTVDSQLGEGKLIDWKIKRESEYGNKFLEARVQDVAPGGRVVLKYSISRRELSNPLQGATSATTPTAPSARFLMADLLLPLGGPIAALTKETVKGATWTRK